MAIQLPNPGLGDGQTGDNEFVMWTKVKDNFNNQTHAASRLVGEGAGNLVEFGAFGLGKTLTTTTLGTLTKTGTGLSSYVAAGSAVGASGIGGTPASFIQTSGSLTAPYQTWRVYAVKGALLYQYANAGSSGSLEWSEPHAIYHTLNTTKDVATGFLKASSPVLHVYNDSITKIHEAEQLDIKVDKKGVGHYEIHGTTGLRKNDGWFMSPPRDVHGNVLCMVDLDEKDGVVILKTYKKKFDFETVSIVHDYESPMDIPDGVCVEFRFNDLPQEQLDEPIE